MSEIIIPLPEPAYGSITTYHWKEYGVTMKVSNIRERGDSITAETTFLLDTHLVDVCRVNLLNLRERSSVGNHLGDRAAGLPWKEMLTQMSSLTVAWYRTEDPSEDTAIGEIENLSYTTNPTLQKGVSTLFFGDYGTGKSTLAYAHAISTAYGVDLPGGISPRITGPVVIYDWETSVNNVKSGVRSLARGMEVSLKPDSIIVRHLVRPLADSVESLRAEIERIGAVLVIIDSQSQAMDSGGQSEVSVPVKEMFRALQSFNVTTLIIGQVSKKESQREGSREPYGSRHISYLCEDTWEFRGLVDPMTKTLTTAMHHRKHRGPWHPPFIFTVEFPQEGIRLLKTGQIQNEPEIAGGDTQTRRILSFLTENGQSSVMEISGATRIADNRIRTLLSTLKSRGLVAKFGDKWGALATGREAL